MKKRKTKLTCAVLLALVLAMTLAVSPAQAGGNILVRKYIQADTGGTIRAGGISIVIPPKALPRNAMITMKVSPDKQEMQFTPDMKFRIPVLVQFSFKVNQVVYWDHGRWVPVPTVDNTAVLAHFSRYAWW
jgi:hypothetical protein